MIPPIFDKYEAELIEKRLLEGNDRIYYCDLDYDGKSERIHLANNTKSGTPIIITYDDTGLLIYDWTLPEPWMFWSDLFFADYNNDGIKEIIVFTQKGDSVFINGYTVYPELDRLFRKYVDQVFTYQGKYHSEIWNGEAIDVDDDGAKELYFVINSGYSKQPRNVYVYYPKNDSIAKSPRSGSSITQPPIFADLNNDGLDEILLSSYASG
ncbi:MAG: hypothetical protein KQH67_13080, partial [Bacteroidetes bacterium]|nr:hypothetical protein [Bacteroidota bacterium]